MCVCLLEMGIYVVHATPTAAQKEQLGQWLIYESSFKLIKSHKSLNHFVISKDDIDVSIEILSIKLI